MQTEGMAQMPRDSLDAERGNVREEEKTCVYTGRQTPVEDAGRSRPETFSQTTKHAIIIPVQTCNRGAVR